MCKPPFGQDSAVAMQVEEHFKGSSQNILW